MQATHAPRAWVCTAADEQLLAGDPQAAEAHKHEQHKEQAGEVLRRQRAVRHVLRGSIRTGLGLQDDPSVQYPCAAKPSIGSAQPAHRPASCLISDMVPNMHFLCWQGERITSLCCA